MKLSDCRKCGLCKKQESGFRRSQVVLGEGSTKYRLMFVVEAPGEYEDRNRSPLWHETPAGEMFGKVLKNLSLKRELVYTTSAVKCRPTQVGPTGPKNRNPTDIEVSSCRPWIVKEIIRTKPKLIVTMGAVSMKSVVGVGGVTRHTGRLIRVREFDCYVFPLLHPASILNDNSLKERMKKDIISLRAALKEVF
jgi:uracil-DNA glycosylase